MKAFEIERIRSVEDLETVLMEEGENGELARQMKVSERSKFRTIKESGKKKNLQLFQTIDSNVVF